MKTGIIVAIKEELASLTQEKIAKGEFISLTPTTLLCFSGAGRKNAEYAAEMLIEQGAERLISWGCAAALKSSLKPGDLIMPQTLITEDDEAISIASPWLHYVLENLPELNAHTGSLVDAGRIISKSSEKKWINRKSRAIALDMESVAISQAGIKHDIPVLVVRAIADSVEMDLPNAIEYAMNPQGEVQMVKLFSYLITHPVEVPGLFRLGQDFSKAKDKLKLVAEHLDIITGFEKESVVS